MSASRHGTRTQPVHSVGRWIFLAGIASSSWTEIGIAGVFLGDLLFFSGGLLILMTHRKVPAASGGSSAVKGLLLSGWLVVLSAAVVAARHPGFSGLGTSVRIALVLVAGPLFMLAFVRTQSDAVRALGALFVSAAVNGVFAISDLVVGLHISPAQLSWNSYPPLALQRAVGLTAHPNVLGYLTAVTLPLAPVMLTTVRTRRGRWSVAAATLLIGAGLLLSGSRGAAVGAAAGLLYIGMRSRRPGVKWGVIGLTVVLVCSAWLLRDASLFSRLLGGASAAASNEGRRENLAEGWRLAADGLPTGVGFSHISQIHSGIVAILAAGGVLGALGFSAWGAQVSLAVRQGSRSPETLTRNIALGCGGATVGMATFLLMSPIIFHRYAVVPASVAIALGRLGRENSPRGYQGSDVGPHVLALSRLNPVRSRVGARGSDPVATSDQHHTPEVMG